MASLEDYLFTKNTRWLAWGFVALVMALLIFLAGISVGRRAALRGPRPHDDFSLPFAPQGFMIPGGFIPRGHGAVGTISAIASSTFILQELDGDTEEVAVASTTIIKDAQGGSAALALGERIVVLGSQSDATSSVAGRIDANFIRILQH